MSAPAASRKVRQKAQKAPCEVWDLFPSNLKKMTRFRVIRIFDEYPRSVSYSELMVIARDQLLAEESAASAVHARAARRAIKLGQPIVRLATYKGVVLPW